MFLELPTSLDKLCVYINEHFFTFIPTAVTLRNTRRCQETVGTLANTFGSCDSYSDVYMCCLTVLNAVLIPIPKKL